MQPPRSTRQRAATQTPPLCPGESSHRQLPHDDHVVYSTLERPYRGQLSSTLARPSRFGARAIDRRPERPQRGVASF